MFDTPYNKGFLRVDHEDRWNPTQKIHFSHYFFFEYITMEIFLDKKIQYGINYFMTFLVMISSFNLHFT